MVSGERGFLLPLFFKPCEFHTICLCHLSRATVLLSLKQSPQKGHPNLRVFQELVLSIFPSNFTSQLAVEGDGVWRSVSRQWPWEGVTRPGHILPQKQSGLDREARLQNRVRAGPFRTCSRCACCVALGLEMRNASPVSPPGRGRLCTARPTCEKQVIESVCDQPRERCFGGKCVLVKPRGHWDLWIYLGMPVSQG